MSKTKTLYLYLGPAYRLYSGETQPMPVAYDDSGNQVIQKIYVNAVSVEQAGCFIKKRIRDKYGIPSAKITLNKKYLYVKNMNK